MSDGQEKDLAQVLSETPWSHILLPLGVAMAVIVVIVLLKMLG